VPVDEGPTLRRRRLGAELRRCREAAGLTQEQVSRRFEWHAAKANRIETARVSVTPRDVRDLLDLYSVHDEAYREELLNLARASREKAWWSEYRDVVRPGSYIAMESEASEVLNWEPDVVPGLLQTEAYMRALFSVHPEASGERSVAIRRERQRRLTGDHPIELSALIDESVIHRQIGGPQVMCEQLGHLIELSELPSVTLRLLPYAAGEHPFLGASMAILGFRDAPGLDVVYAEDFGQQHYIKNPDEVRHWRAGFDRLSRSCLDEFATNALIKAQLSG
jgi:transcriptional regulator with XRE-family HTH domain